jgi:putative oxidoreductase
MTFKPTFKFVATSEAFLAYSLAIIFIIFGALKVFEISPVRELVVATMGLFDNTWLFRLLGLAEVAMGIGLLYDKTKKWAAGLIVLHLAAIYLVSLINPGILFSRQTFLSFNGEFILKNLVLGAVAAHIYLTEKGELKVLVAEIKTALQQWLQRARTLLPKLRRQKA